MDQLSEKEEFKKLTKLYPKTFKRLFSKKHFELNEEIDFEFHGVQKANEMLFEKYGGLRKYNFQEEEKKPKSKGKEIETGKSEKKPLKKKKKAPSEVLKIEEEKSTRSINGLLKKDGLVSSNPLPTLMAYVGKKFTKKKGKLPNPTPGFRIVKWLGTDTEEEDMSISEESSDDLENLENEADLVLGFIRQGMEAEDLFEKEEDRPLNTHLCVDGF